MTPLFKVVTHGALIYAAVVVSVFLLQNFLIFPRYAVNFDNLSKLEAGEEVIHLTTAEHETLEGLIAKTDTPSNNLMIAFAGNAYDSTVLVRFLKVVYPEITIVGFNYRGYGGSTGAPSEKALFSDSLAIYDHLAQKFPEKNIYAFGVSLGTSVASYLASQKDVKGLVLVTPFDSLNKVAKNLYPFLPVDLLLRHHFDTTPFIKDVQVPVSIISAENDEVIPKKRTEMLKKIVPNLVYTKEVKKARHNDVLVRPESITDLQAAFLKMYLHDK